jgi:hypothetical protein
MFGFVISPGLDKLSPSSSGEFLLKDAPRVGRYFQIVAGLTILSGALLLYNLGGFGLLSLPNGYGVELSIGVTLALAAFVVVEFVAVLALFRAICMIHEMQFSGQHAPPAGFPKTLRVVKSTGTPTVDLLILTSIFIAGARFY